MPVRARPWLLTLMVCLLVPGPTAADEDAEQVLRRAQAQARAATVHGTYRVEITRPDWQRTLHLDTYEDQVNGRHALVLTAPPKVAGITFLEAGGRLWMYMPNLRKRVAISPAMMLEPWMGSDLNNQDLLEADSLIDHYTHRIIGRRPEGDQEVVVIESEPRPDAPVVWGRLRHEIRSDGVPVSVGYFDRKGERVRTVSLDAVRSFDERMIPTHWTVQPAGQPDQRTELFIEALAFDVPLPESVFERLPSGSEPAP